jgi:hypothetical protein
MAGLDNIKGFDDGGSTGTEGAISYTAPKATGLSDKIAISPTQTEDILANMQKYIDERESPFAKFAGGLSAGMATARGPAALAIYQRQKQEEDKQTMDYRQQMAAFRAAQDQAKINAAKYASMTPGAEGTLATAAGKGTTDPSGVFVPASQLALEATLGTDAERLQARAKFLNTKTTETIKADLNPASLDRKPTVIMNPNTRKPEVRDINRFEYEQLKQKGLILDASSYYEAPAGKLPGTMTGTVAGAEAAQPLSVRNNNPGNLKDPKTGELRVFATPQEGQKALEDDLQGKISGQSPVLKQRFGDTGGFISPAMLAETWSPSTAAGNTPESTINYGKYIAAKLGIDPTAKIPNTPEAKAAIAQAIKEFESGQAKSNQIAGAPSVQVASTGMPDVANILAQRKVSETEQTAAAEARGKSGEAMRTAFEADTDPGTLDDSYATSRRIQQIVKQDPTLSGVINQPGVAAAVAGVVQKGIGNFGVADLENAIFKSLPTTTQKSLGERSELISYLAKIELQTAKLIKGQGQITEGEREILQRASSSISDPAELIYKKAKVLERVTKMNEELAQVYGTGENFTNFRKFKDDPEFKRIHKEFRGDLENILKESPSFVRPIAGQPTAVKPQVQHPQEIQDIINRNKAK